MLRSYLPKEHPLKHLELGSEKTPREYVEKMVRVFRLVREVLADHGTVWLNVGDTYAHSMRHSGAAHAGTKQNTNNGSIRNGFAPGPEGVPEGNLCLIPQRLAISLQDDGWIVRSVIVWHKPAPMPSSVSGWAWRRCRVKTKAQELGNQSRAGRRGTGAKSRDCIGGEWQGSAEFSDCPGCPKCKPTNGYVLRRGSWRPTSSWEPILMLAKSKGYFCDGEAVKQPAATATISRNEYTRIIDDPEEQFAAKHDHEYLTTTANLRDVWTIASEPLKAKHYAAFPSELVHRCLKAGTSARGYCPECGKPWVRIIDAKTESTYAKVKGDIGWREMTAMGQANGENPHRPNSGQTRRSDGSQPHLDPIVTETIGWRPSCSHNLDPRPGLVLDPFAGSGRTAVEAHRLGLDFVGCELNPEYVDMANGIIGEEAGLFAEQMERSRR